MVWASTDTDRGFLTHALTCISVTQWEFLSDTNISPTCYETCFARDEIRYDTGNVSRLSKLPPRTHGNLLLEFPLVSAAQMKKTVTDCIVKRLFVSHSFAKVGNWSSKILDGDEILVAAYAYQYKWGLREVCSAFSRKNSLINNKIYQVRRRSLWCRTVRILGLQLQHQYLRQWCALKKPTNQHFAWTGRMAPLDAL